MLFITLFLLPFLTGFFSFFAFVYLVRTVLWLARRLRPGNGQAGQRIATATGLIRQQD
jgi:hypothetical protein